MRQLSPIVLAAAMCGLAACGASAKEVREAKSSGYQADFAVVFSEALAVVTKRYPRLDDSPRRGVIQTAWHPVNISQSSGNYSGQPQGNRQPGAQTGGLGTARVARTFYFVRFRVKIVGGRPWRVRIEGEASKWEEGATPVRLRGADLPPWLPGRVDSLQLKIHRRLKKYAVRLRLEEVKKTAKKDDDEPIPANLASLPKSALRVVRAARKAATTRRYAELRNLVATDVVWSQGAPGSAEQAMAIWQADPSLLVKLAESIEAGCDLKGQRVRCGNNKTLSAVFAKKAQGWRLSEFVSPE